MRYFSAIVLAVIVSAVMCQPSHLFAQANDSGEKSVVGTWSVESFKVDGKPANGPLASWKPGAVWKFKSDGTGRMGEDDVTRWSFDRENSELSVYGKSFGFELAYFEKATVKWLGDEDLRLKFAKLGLNIEVILTPD